MPFLAKNANNRYNKAKRELFMDNLHYLFSLLAFSCVCLCAAGLFMGFRIAALVCGGVAFVLSGLALFCEGKAKRDPALASVFLFTGSITAFFMTFIALFF